MIDKRSLQRLAAHLVMLLIPAIGIAQAPDQILVQRSDPDGR